MNSRGRLPLQAAAAASLGVAALHIAIVFVGPPGYRYFGAPVLAKMVERGSAVGPALLTLAVAFTFALWGAYALSGARVLRRLPFLRAGLLVIGAVYVLRGLQGIPEALGLLRGTLKYPRAVVFSAVALAVGLCYLVGAVRAWPVLGSGRPPAAPGAKEEP